MLTRLIALAAAIISAAAVAVACTALHPAARPPAAATVPPPAAAPAALPGPAAGIVTDDLARFDAACSCRPAVAVAYVRWGTPPDPAWLRAMQAAGSVPLVELEPYGTTAAAITAGRSDGWLSRWARAVGGLGGLVLASFAPEPNTRSYPWGYGHAAPAAYTAALRHVVSVFRRAGAARVQWAWIVNAASRDTAPLSPLWPGAGYMSYAGIDGYATRGSATFAGLFGTTISQVRSITRVPVLITETAADPAAGQARWIAQLAAGVRAYRLAGFVWFDIDQTGGHDPGAPRGNRHDWALTGAALAAYARTAGSRMMMNPPHR